MISSLDQRIFYLDDYNPISTMTVEFSKDINLKFWISKIFDISITEIISPKILVNVLRDCQSYVPKQILTKLGKVISNPNLFLYSYLKTLMLFSYNPLSSLNHTTCSLFEENSYRDIFNKALQKFIDPTSYLFSMQIISLLALTELRMQVMKKHKESNTRFLETFEKFIDYEIVFNSAPEFSVIDLKGIASEIEYVALTFIPQNQINLERLEQFPTLILQVSEGLIFINIPKNIRILQKILEKHLIFQASSCNHKINALPQTEEIMVPTELVQSIEQFDNKEEENDEIPDNRMKKMGLSDQKQNFMVSGNLGMGMAMPEEEFFTSPGD